MKWLLRLVLAMVIVSEINSLWVAFTNRDAYLRVFPGATGPLYFLTVVVTAAAGVNAALLWVGRRWAIPLNVVIGVVSIVVIELVGGPRSNQLIVAAACAASTTLAFAVQRPRAPLSAAFGP